MKSDVEEAINILTNWKNDDSQVEIYQEMISYAKLAFNEGGKLLFCGNGGSSAEAAHFAAEFVGKCSRASLPLPSISLSESSVQFSAIANDYGFDQTFIRGLKAFAKSPDLVILLSTSGVSKNVVEALNWCKENEIKVSLWTSQKYTPGLVESDFTIVAPTISTPRAQELHLLLGHLMAEDIEKEYSE
jgi:D-sedoheptulose 7-phosphate isomerase